MDALVRSSRSNSSPTIKRGTSSDHRLSGGGKKDKRSGSVNKLSRNTSSMNMNSISHVPSSSLLAASAASEPAPKEFGPDLTEWVCNKEFPNAVREALKQRYRKGKLSAFSQTDYEGWVYGWIGEVAFDVLSMRDQPDLVIWASAHCTRNDVSLLLRLVKFFRDSCTSTPKEGVKGLLVTLFITDEVYFVAKAMALEVVLLGKSDTEHPSGSGPKVRYLGFVTQAAREAQTWSDLIMSAGLDPMTATQYEKLLVAAKLDFSNLRSLTYDDLQSAGISNEHHLKSISQLMRDLARILSAQV